jgi:hypothetical protein
MRQIIQRCRRMRLDTLGAFSYGALWVKTSHISVNNNKNFKSFWILSIYTIWDGLSLKTISRYCPFKHNQKYRRRQNIGANGNYWPQQNSCTDKILALTKISRRQNSRADKNLASTKISLTQKSRVDKMLAQTQKDPLTVWLGTNFKSFGFFLSTLYGMD